MCVCVCVCERERERRGGKRRKREGQEEYFQREIKEERHTVKERERKNIYRGAEREQVRKCGQDKKRV